MKLTKRNAGVRDDTRVVIRDVLIRKLDQRLIKLEGVCATHEKKTCLLMVPISPLLA